MFIKVRKFVRGPNSSWKIAEKIPAYYISEKNINYFSFGIIDEKAAIMINALGMQYNTSEGIFLDDTLENFSKAVDIPVEDLSAQLLKLELEE